tara:strand:+ start:15 stop:422 length:408 start_codon:yes stop_codon:yes gene_type:complete
MAISSAPTTVFSENREDDAGRTVKAAHVYSFASVATNAFTYPISLAGAKSVWISLSTAAAATLYLPLYEAGAIDVDSDPTAAMSVTTTATGIGVGMDVTSPSTSGAGFIGGGNMPPAISVKNGGAEAIVLIHITY